MIKTKEKTRFRIIIMWYYENEFHVNMNDVYVFRSVLIKLKHSNVQYLNFL